MKIRVTGTFDECEEIRESYKQLADDPNIKSVSVSGFYPNRNSINLFRVYIDVEYYEERKDK